MTQAESFNSFQFNDDLVFNHKIRNIETNLFSFIINPKADLTFSVKPQER